MFQKDDIVRMLRNSCGIPRQNYLLKVIQENNYWDKPDDSIRVNSLVEREGGYSGFTVLKKDVEKL